MLRELEPGDPRVIGPYRLRGRLGRRRHGAGLPRHLGGRPPCGREGHPGRLCHRPRIPCSLPARGRGGAHGERPVHRSGDRRGRRGPGAVAGHRLCARAFAGRRRCRAWPAARLVGAEARRRACRGIERDPRGGRGAPGPEASQRAAGRGRAAGDRLRHFPRRRLQPADPDRPPGRLARFHVPGTGRAARSVPPATSSAWARSSPSPRPAKRRSAPGRLPRWPTAPSTASRTWTACRPRSAG